ncbi:MAG: protein translocase subunit SecF [Brevinemataceae bacterium]
MQEASKETFTYFDFLGKRMVALIIFISLSILGIITYFSNGFTLGTDFSGGIRIEFTAPSDIAEIRTLIGNDSISITTLKNVDGQNSFLLTAPAELAKEGSGEYLLNQIKQKYPDTVLLSSDFIGPSVGYGFAFQSLKLLGIVSLLILVYIAFRFDFVYGIGAIAALLHDMIVMLSFALILKIPIDLTTLAAFLTILGYSINDTIVIFDRVRENYNLSPNENFDHIINKSITQSLKRTILTSITTLLVAFSIFIWAGNSLQNFGLLLIIGIISGTYSSIFVASPITYLCFEYKNKLQNKK